VLEYALEGEIADHLGWAAISPWVSLWSAGPPQCRAGARRLRGRHWFAVPQPRVHSVRSNGESMYWIGFSLGQQVHARREGAADDQRGSRTADT
jgi:hypothetical protein